MSAVYIDFERCKGCGLCIAVCPKEILALSEVFNSKGFHPAVCVNQDACTRCALCYRMCPDVAISVELKRAVKK
ncbi:MAG: 4Fe-4S dicluster domain-containing protein [bacterium]